jgi:hypothetical protein
VINILSIISVAAILLVDSNILCGGAVGRSFLKFIHASPHPEGTLIVATLYGSVPYTIL